MFHIIGARSPVKRLQSGKYQLRPFPEANNFKSEQLKFDRLRNGGPWGQYSITYGIKEGPRLKEILCNEVKRIGNSF